MNRKWLSALAFAPLAMLAVTQRDGRAADHLDIAAVARLEAECLGADAWSPWLVEQGIRGELPTVQYVVAEAQ